MPYCKGFTSLSALVLFSYISAAAGSLATKIVLTEAAENNNAVCLDGSPAAYYFRPGSGDGKRKWYIHHEGGGVCQSLDNCLHRARRSHPEGIGIVGSSINFTQTAEIGNMTKKHRGWNGYFSQEPNINPMMHNWNSVFLRYCDGGAFTGFKNSAVLHKGHLLYFRGRAILNAVQEDLLSKRGLNESTDVVIGGNSVGGLAVFLHIDDWADKLRFPGRKIVGLPDSGFFPYYNGTTHWSTRFAWMFQTMNSSGSLNQYCLAAHAGEGDKEDKCMFAEHNTKYVQTPMFVLQSQYDRDQLAGAKIKKNNTERVNQWGKHLTALVENSLLAHVPPRHGIFLDSCWHHCFGWGHFHIGSTTQADVFSTWYQTRGHSAALSNLGYFKQDMPYPCTDCCGGYTSDLYANTSSQTEWDWIETSGENIW